MASGFDNDVMYADNVDFSGGSPVAGKITTDGQLLIGSTAAPNIRVATLTAGSGISITNGAGSITIENTAPTPTDLHTSRYIVSSGGTADGANYTSITSAVAAASAVGGAQTIFIQPGTYTENFTLPVNVNLSAYDCDAETPSVTIVGKITCSDAGRRTISGIRLQTNSDYVLSVTGSAATVVILKNCYLSGTNNSLISSTTSSTSSAIHILYCNGDLSTTGINLFSVSNGTLNIEFSIIDNSGGSDTASTLANATRVTMFYSRLVMPYTASDTAVIVAKFCRLRLGNNTITIAGNTTTQFLECEIDSGTASAITVTGGIVQVYGGVIKSTNTNMITGAGQVTLTNVATTNSSVMNATTQVGTYTQIGKYKAFAQPAFLAYNSVDDTNTTGSGATFTLIFDTEIYDQDSNFDGTSTFTAPVTGRYHFSCVARYEGLTDVMTTANFQLVTSNRTYRDGVIAVGTVRILTNEYSTSISTYADMDAADTVTVTALINGGAGDTVTVSGSAGTLTTYFGGMLVA